jgi:hypothetical protein
MVMTAAAVAAVAKVARVVGTATAEEARPECWAYFGAALGNVSSLGSAWAMSAYDADGQKWDVTGLRPMPSWASWAAGAEWLDGAGVLVCNTEATARMALAFVWALEGEAETFPTAAELAGYAAIVAALTGGRCEVLS